MNLQNTVLILTPVKNAESFLPQYFRLLCNLTYPRRLLSVAFLESDSDDGTYEKLNAKIPELGRMFSSATLFKKDFGFKLAPDLPRWARPIQIQRRTVMAKSRNWLLALALEEQDWVLWLDVDLVDYPVDIIQRLLSTGKQIVQPHCVNSDTGKTFDLNAWRDRGALHLDDLRSEGELVPLHGVGGTMLLIRADIHREGLVFPPFLYGKKSRLIRKSNLMVARRDIARRLQGEHRGEIETEGLGIMAHDMGYECWGMPNLEIKHWSG